MVAGCNGLIHFLIALRWRGSCQRTEILELGSGEVRAMRDKYMDSLVLFFCLHCSSSWGGVRITEKVYLDPDVHLKCECLT